jgi:chemosensory pili system protein ChpC
MTRAPEGLPAIVLPCGAADLLLPNAAVAEVLSFRFPTPIEDPPAWLLGNLEWRERLVPVVSVAAAGQAKEIALDRRARLAVCFTPSGNPSLPYLAFLAVEPPRLALLLAQSLEPGPSAPDNPFVLHALSYVDRPAWIPDFDAIERAVLEALQP